MPPQPKKKPKSSTKKKPAVKSSSKKKAVRKKTKKKSLKSSSFFKKTFMVLGFVFMTLVLTSAYYVIQHGIKGLTSSDKGSKKVEKRVEKLPKPVKVKQKKIVKKPTTQKDSKFSKVTLVPYTNTQPKLVIIIDDVHTRAQIDAIKTLPVKVTPSIFPPYKLAPNSHLLVQGLEHYMIHLPMESGNKKLNSQYKTLKVSFSNSKIENRIKELRLLFPKAKFINNHTGSVFTSNYAAIHLAYKIMRENAFIFLDSKTTHKSKVKEIANAYGDLYVARDIFIDNKHSVSAIHGQLKKAVKIAKKKGYAVAIGHPHKTTMQALATAKNIFKNVELVYIDELYQ